MNKNLDKNNYLVIEDFITPERAKELYKKLKSDSKEYPQYFTTDHQAPNSIAIYDYSWFVELLVEKTPLLTKLMKEPMLPTYSYSRIYSKGEELVKHTDRPACEISLTLHLGSDGTKWPIYFTAPDGEVVSVVLKPGQAVMYKGMVSEHWRDKFKGNHYAQVFLHYVRAHGEHSDCYFDKNQQTSQPTNPIDLIQFLTDEEKKQYNIK